MNAKQKWLAVLGAFVVIWASDFLIHHLWLGDFYRAHAHWWRPEAEMASLMHVMFLAQLILAWLLVLVYARGYEADKAGLAQGIRFGLLMGVLLMGPSSLMHLVVYPYPSFLIGSWFLGGLMQLILAGAVVGALYKPAK